MSESQEDFSKELNDSGFNLIYTNIKRKVGLKLARSMISNKLEVGQKIHLHDKQTTASVEFIASRGYV